MLVPAVSPIVSASGILSLDVDRLAKFGTADSAAVDWLLVKRVLLVGLLLPASAVQAADTDIPAADWLLVTRASLIGLLLPASTVQAADKDALVLKFRPLWARSPPTVEIAVVGAVLG